MEVPDASDMVEMRQFLDITLWAYDRIVETARMRAGEREALRVTLEHFVQENHLDRIVSQYARLSDEETRDIGLYAEQLRQKRIMAELAAHDVVDGGSRGQRSRIRRWLKRTKLISGSLKRLVPGAEALGEFLDLLDAALDPT